MADIMEEDWDYLLILDACRYDYFEEVYQDYIYIKGELKKVETPAHGTKQWLEEVFNDRYDDVVYVSANPWINSIGFRDFDARKHFHEIIDVWDWGWDHESGTVPPKKVNEALLEVAGNFPKKRFIVHYMQPHSPYLTVKGGMDEAEDSFFISRRLRLFFGPILRKFVGQKKIEKVRGILGLNSSRSVEEMAKQKGEEALHEAYEENLRIVLSHVESLIKDISGKVVVTSDHGECLGEDGIYGHPSEYDSKVLIEVPWLEIRKNN